MSNVTSAAKKRKAGKNVTILLYVRCQPRCTTANLKLTAPINQ